MMEVMIVNMVVTLRMAIRMIIYRMIVIDKRKCRWYSNCPDVLDYLLCKEVTTLYLLKQDHLHILLAAFSSAEPLPR